jgi:FkbM family methyltransferase
MLTKFLRLLKVAKGKDFFVSRELKKNTITLGNKNAEWTFIPDMLSEKSIVYSFGIGHDISWDKEMISRYNLKIHAFDPTQRCIQWLKTQDLPGNFIVHKSGLAAFDGEANFKSPSNPNHVSARIVNNEVTQTYKAPVKRLSTIMTELSHSQIDLLKMDIESAEYEAIDDLINSEININQLLIEFHHRFPEVGIAKSKNAIDSLRKAGFKVFHVSNTGEEISFIKMN